MTERLPDWEQRLSDFIEEHRDRPFAWGQWDCILFACAAAAAITGEDKAAPFRGQYSTARGARRVLRQMGQGTLLRTVNAHFTPKPAAFAQRGDLVWHAGCVGVSLGKAAAFLTDPAAMDALAAQGMAATRLGQFVMIPRAEWLRAWEV